MAATDLHHPEPVEVIVLGRRLEEDGRVSGIFRHRLDQAAAVFRAEVRQGRAARLVVSGGDLGRRGITEARAGANYLQVEHGLAGENVVLEERALDTVSNAIYCKLLCRARGCTKLLVVSSCYHTPRVAYIFSHVFGPQFELAYVSAPTGLEASDYARHWHSESRKIIEAVQIIDRLGAGPGEHEGLFAYLRERGCVVEDTVE
ncbi:MAG: YdcF family protein [Planctomycetota bacterium]